MNWLRLFWRGLLGCLLLGVILLNPYLKPTTGYSREPAAVATRTPLPMMPASTPSPTVVTPTIQSLFAPLIANNIGLPAIELDQVWIADGKGNRQDAFLSNNELRFYGLGYSRVLTDSIHLRWNQNGPCGTSQVFSGTVQVNPGSWEAYLSSTAPSCIGIYTNTLSFKYKQYTNTLTADFVVNPPSQVIYSDQQGFDRCNIPSISDMQTWWYKSPYYSINLYIGGSLSHCSNQDLNALWVQEVAKQGWTFIPTWVGPQAPCSKYRYRISYDPQISYLQGQAEADSAIKASGQIGLLGGSIIYYDVESYVEGSNNQTCRDAMSSFLTGWTERLHNKGYLSGAYGSSYSSYIADWVDISPTLDDVWIARWQIPYQYNQNATVLGDPNLSDNLWPHHRIRQYAGDHIETWGGVSMPIDSDVIDGEVSYLPITSTQSLTNTIITDSSSLYIAVGPRVRDMQAIQDGVGWFLVGDQLRWRNAVKKTWSQTTLSLPKGEATLALTFHSVDQGWLAAQDSPTGEITIYAYDQHKGNWVEKSKILPASLPGKAWLSFIDGNTGWLALRLQSSSNFSLGQLFRTDDGGRSWVELPVPTGGQVHFTDRSNGWLKGGPTGGDFYATQDGGHSWTKLAEDAQGKPPRFTELASISRTYPGVNFDQLPGTILDAQFSDSNTGWALVQVSACTGDKNPVRVEKSASVSPFLCTSQQLIFETRDGGRTWARLPL
jgi:hypothetical protein